MTIANIDAVTVLGAGTMGHGIAEVAALAGYDVTIRDVEEELLEEALEDIEWSLDKLVERGELGEDEADTARERISTTVDVGSALDDADVIIEAVPERLDIKQAVYEDVAAEAPAGAILATNTSGLSIDALAEATDRPAAFCGMHFFNPPVRMDLVEVIGGERTDASTLETIEALAESMGKEPVRVEKDAPGFIVNRILIQYLNDAAWRVATDESTIAAVDASTKYELGLPMGAFELADQVGLDVANDILVYLHEELGAAYEPSPLIKELVADGRLGRKSNAGFYNYDDGGVEIQRSEGSSELGDRLLAVMANEVAKLLAEDVAGPDAIDRAMQLGAGFPQGPIGMADERGPDALVEYLEADHDRVDHPRYAVADRLRTAADESGFRADHDGDSFETIRIERPVEHVGVIVLDRAHRMNAITTGMLDELERAIERLEAEDTRAVVIRGAGDRAFSAGADLQAMPDVLDAPAAAIELSTHGQDAFARLRASPLPIIAGIDGYCLGGGFELAAAADLRIATSDATFGQTERNLGLIPGWGGTQHVAPIIGRGRALELVLTGDHYDAETMERYGFINRVVDRTDFEEEVLTFAGEIADGPPLAMGAAKRVVYAGDGEPTAGLEAEAQAFGQLTATDDLTEGVTAFLEDREPDFTGT